MLWLVLILLVVILIGQGILLRKVKRIMANQADLDAAIVVVSTKIDAIVPGTPVDLQPQVDAVVALGTKLDAKFPPAA